MYNSAQIVELLRSEGFEAATFRDASHVVSDGNSDLGMMARRWLVVARVAADRPLRPVGRYRDIHVVPGDLY